jgi:hypothetical protein
MVVRCAARLAAVTVLPVVAIVPRDALHDAQAPRVGAGGGATLSLDMDILDGACTDIDASVSRSPAGPAESVAVCLAQSGTVAVAAFQYRISYNDNNLSIPEVADIAPALDDNPDANAGSTTFSSPSLGGGWDCSGGVGAHPKGDLDGTQNGTGVAFSGGCGSASGPNTLLSGPLGVVTLGNGPAWLYNTPYSLTIEGAQVINDDLSEIGSCAPVEEVAMICNGGTITFVECENVFVHTSDDDIRIVNGPEVLADYTWPRHDRVLDACDVDDDNDGIIDDDEASGATCNAHVTNKNNVDTDGDHLIDGWECQHGSDPTDPASTFMGGPSGDVDSDRVPDVWEQRGYNGLTDSSDSDNDICPDMTEIASVDGNRAITDADRLAVARRALGIYASHPGQDWLLDVSANGVVDDADRLFVARAALLPEWQPKTCF